MKTKSIVVAIAATALAGTAVGVFITYGDNPEVNPLAMANIEALSDDECTDGWKTVINVQKSTTDHGTYVREWTVTVTDCIENGEDPDCHAGVHVDVDDIYKY